MALSLANITKDEKLGSLSHAHLRQGVLNLRNALRWHRDQRGDDRCWADDIRLYELIPEKEGVITRLPEWEKMYVECSRFKQMRGSDKHTEIGLMATDSGSFDSDLDKMDGSGLVTEIMKLRDAIIKHRKLGPNKTSEDDAELYALLPEKIPGDFWLPSELLTNCRRFWETKQTHNPERIHEW